MEFGLTRQIRRLQMKRRLDPVDLGRGILESRAHAQVSAQDRRTGGDIGKLSAHTHDLIRVHDSLEILPVRRVGRFPGTEEADLARLEALAQDEGAITSKSGIDEVLRESLRLRLNTDKEGHSKNHAR